jgi:hypothetical protein
VSRRRPRLALSAPIAAALCSAAAGDPAVPAYPYRVAGVCPFECCQYGEWTAHEAIPVHARERGEGKPSFTIAAGETFTAVGGAYWTLAPVVLRLRAPAELRAETGVRVVAPDRAELRAASASEQRVALPAGSEIRLIAYLGEGEGLGLAGDKPVSVSGVYPPLGQEGGAAPDYELVPPVGATEWWVEVKAGKRHGWFERGKYDIDGSDRCE